MKNVFKIKTPNSNYNGNTWGVQFVNGIGETKDKEVRDILIKEFKYEMVKEKEETKTDEDK